MLRPFAQLQILCLIIQKVHGLLWVWQGQCLDFILLEYCPLRQLLHQSTQHSCQGYITLLSRPVHFLWTLECASLLENNNFHLTYQLIPVFEYRLTMNVRCARELYIVQISTKRWFPGIIHSWMWPRLVSEIFLHVLFVLSCVGFSSWC